MPHLPSKPKLYYRMGEVCRMLDLEPHVLRFWETEFPQVKPGKNRSGHRIFKQEDIDLLKTIKKLLHEQGFTIAGARKHLEQATTDPAEPGLPTPAIKQELNEIKILLENSLKLLDEAGADQ